MPSRTEGFGLTALEALSAGLPVLVSRNSGLGEALQEVPIGSNCVVESEDPKDWANAIKAVRKKKRKLRLREAKLLQGEYAEIYRWQDHCNRLVERMLAISQENRASNEQDSSVTATVDCHTGEKSSCSEKLPQKGSSNGLQPVKKGKRPLPPSGIPGPKHSRLSKDEGESCPTAPVDCRKDCFSDNQCVAEEGQAHGQSVLSAENLNIQIDCNAIEQGGASSTQNVSGKENVVDRRGPSSQELLNRIADDYLQAIRPPNLEKLNGFLQYMKEARQVIVVDVKTGSLIITVRCTSLRILDDLWKDYCTGHLQQVAQRYLVTEDILQQLSLDSVQLTLTISEEEYKACRNHFLKNEGIVEPVANTSLPDDLRRLPLDAIKTEGEQTLPTDATPTEFSQDLSPPCKASTSQEGQGNSSSSPSSKELRAISLTGSKEGKRPLTSSSTLESKSPKTLGDEGGKKKPSFEQTAETGMLSNTGEEEEVVKTVLPVKVAKEEVVVDPEDKTEVEDNTYVGESRSVITEEIVTSEGTRWALELGTVHLIFHPNAVSEPTSIVVYRWKSSVCSPPLQEHEAIVSNVIELSTHDGQRLKFSAMVTLSLSHSAPDLRGYEVVIKRQINKETNEWEDMSGTKNLRCRQDFEDEHPSHKDIPDLFFPIAQTDIYECSTYAVVCRLKSSPTYSVISTGGLFSHPDYPGVTVTIPENAVAPESSFTLVLKVQEVPNKEFEEEGVFLGPILRINCFEVVQFFRPVTIQLPVSLRDQQDVKPDLTTCSIRVLFLNCEEEKKEWVELTDLVEPTQFDAKFVRIQVQRFSRYSFFFERLGENSRAYGLRILSYLSRFTRTQPRAASFVAYFRPDTPNILFLICCSAHLKQEVIQDLENRDVTRFADGSSRKYMIPGEDGDKVFVSLSGGIRPFYEEDVNSIYLRLLEDDVPFKTELRVRLVDDEGLAQVEFRNTLTHTDRRGLLCKFHLTLPFRKMPHAADQNLRELARQPEIKDGSPSPDELEGLSEEIIDKWKKLGRRLHFSEAQITEHDKNNDKLPEKAFKLLMAWEKRDASAATYRVLCKALSDVKRRDLAQEFCCQ